MLVKTVIGRVRIESVAVLLLVGSAHFPQLSAQKTSSPIAPATKPAIRIELSATGYREPSPMDRLSEDEPAVSLDFVDADHLLLVFDRKQLFQRLPGCTPDHDDRLMHAVILEMPSGKVLKQSDWYLHDRRRYLWPLSAGPLGPGKFLLRKGNDLYVVDASLQEKLLLHSPKNLLWVSVTPDASEIITESAIDSDAFKDLNPRAATSPVAPKAGPRFVAQFLDAKTLAPRRTLTFHEVVDLNGTSAGYADLVHKGDIWLLRFGPTTAKRRNIARVRSRTVPSVLYSSDNSLLIGRCPSPDCDYSVTAFAVTGRRLWQQHWTRYRVFPVIVGSADHSRFAVSTLRLAVERTPPGAAAPDDPHNPLQLDISEPEAFQQEVQIFETASGSALLSVNVTPAVLTGQNFTLSPDGRRLAVLQGSGLELFNLPPSSQEEQVKFASLRSDVQDVFKLESMPDNATPADEAAESDPPASLVADEAPNPSAEKELDPHPAGEASDPNHDPATAAVNHAVSAPPAVTTAAATATPNPEVTISEPITTFKVATKAVVVDVVVTDSKGHPIKGLQHQDFHLAEDSKGQDISYFREFSDSGADVPPAATSSRPVSAASSSPTTPPAPVPSPAKPLTNVFSNHARPGQPGAVTIVLFDLLNTPLQDQSYARQQLIKFLQSKPKDSQFALCTLSGGPSPLRLIEGFTADETLLLAAAKGSKGSPKVARWKASATGTENAVGIVGVLAQGGPTSGFQSLLSGLQGMQDQQRVTDTDARVGTTTDAMMLLARYLSGIPGRKNVVWLSGSFPMSILTTPNSGAADNHNYAYKIKRLTNLLAESQVAVYPVDVRGLIGGGPSADSAGTMGGPPPLETPNTRGGLILLPSAPIPQSMQVSGQQEDERETLMQFAIATGGTAFLNSNGISQAIATANEQGSNYYTLSYSPSNKLFDGKFRKIKVALAERGYKLHYRQGYFADDTHSAAKDAELARLARAVAMQYGSPPSRQLLFSANVVPVGSKKKMDPAKIGEVPLASAKPPSQRSQVEAQHYSVDYSFQGSELHFIPLKNQNYRDTLILMVASFDREGRMLTGISDLAATELNPDVYKTVIAGELSGRQEFDVPTEAALLRLGIQDQLSNHLGTVDIPLPVPIPPGTRHRLKNPLPEIEPD